MYIKVLHETNMLPTMGQNDYISDSSEFAMLAQEQDQSLV